MRDKLLKLFKTYKEEVALLLLTLPYIYKLGYDPFWIDEVYTFYFSYHTEYGFLDFFRFYPMGIFDSHPTGFYFLSRAYAQLISIFDISDKEVILRSFAWLASASYLIVFYKIVKKFLLPKIAFSSSLVLSQTAFFFLYAREARMYPLNVLLLLLTIYFFLSVESQKSSRDRKLFYFFGLLAQWTHFSSVLHMAGILIYKNLASLKDKSINIKSTLFDGLYFILGSSFLIRKQFFEKEVFYDYISWMPSPTLKTFKLFFLETFVKGNYSNIFFEDFMNVKVLSVVFYLIVLVSAFNVKNNKKIFLFVASPLLFSFLYYLLTDVSTFKTRGFAVFVVFSVFYFMHFLYRWFGEKTYHVLTVFLFLGLFYNNYFYSNFFNYNRNSDTYVLAKKLKNYGQSGLIHTCSPFIPYFKYVFNKHGLNYKFIRDFEITPKGSPVVFYNYWCQLDGEKLKELAKGHELIYDYRVKGELSNFSIYKGNVYEDI